MSVFGRYFHQIDNKGRMRIPAKMKASLGENIYILAGNQRCLYIYSETEFNKFADKLSELSAFDDSAADASRILSSCVQIDEDDQGRFTLPSFLRQHAGLVKDITFLGVGNRGELWSTEEWTARESDISANNPIIKEQLQKVGL